MIVGLGNIGRDYGTTRHNVGFMVADEIALRFKKKFTPGKGEYYAAEASLAGEKVVVLKPTTFVNNSGIAVKAAMEKYEMAVDDLLVVCDDFNLPIGRLRLRKSGSDGGHNGLYSVIYQLNNDCFPRLRCGIAQAVPGSVASPPRGEVKADFVLSTFEADEIPAVEKMIRTAADATFSFITEGIENAMNKFN